MHFLKENGTQVCSYHPALACHVPVPLLIKIKVCTDDYTGGNSAVFFSFPILVPFLRAQQTQPQM